MRALTIMQPWAHAIAWCGKGIENRNTAHFLEGYRGELMIHAGLSNNWLSDAACFEVHMAAKYDAEAKSDFPSNIHLALPRLVFGAVVALATLVDVVHGSEAWKLHPFQRVWARQGNGALLVLNNVRPLKSPVRASGAQGLWTPSDELIAAVRDQLEGKAGQSGEGPGEKTRAPIAVGGLFGSHGRML